MTESKFFRERTVPVDCDAIFSDEVFRIEGHGLKEAPHSIPAEWVNEFTLNGRSSVSQAYYDQKYVGSTAETSVWTVELVNGMIDQANRRALSGTYGVTDTNALLDALDHAKGIKGGRVLVIGSENPWVEACVLAKGASSVTTLEYGVIQSEHPRITTLLPKDFRQKWKSLPHFDAIVTYSSVEHSGLGRYGDALNPWGDVLEIARARCVSKPGASLTIAVPFGGDAIVFNAHRVYGNFRYPYLASNWKQVWRQPQGAFQKIHVFETQSLEDSHSNGEHDVQRDVVIDAPSKKDIVIIFTYRDRMAHYTKHAAHLNANIKRPDWNLHVFVVEQGNTEPFNRAWLFNVGIDEVRKRGFGPDTCIVTSDIDMLASQSIDYAWCDRPTQICSELSCWNGGVAYHTYSGGVVQASRKHWEQINGFTNRAIGWGGEDDELYHRFRQNGLLEATTFFQIPFFSPKNALRRPAKGMGKCTCLHDSDHTKRTRDQAGYRSIVAQISRLASGSKEWETDGLSSLSYRTIREWTDNFGTEWFKVDYGTTLHVNTKGRFGNHLFMYASAAGLAARSDQMRLCVHTNLLRTVFQGLPGAGCATPSSGKKWNEGGRYGTFVDVTFDQDTVIEDSYLQSWKYFGDIKDDLQAQFSSTWLPSLKQAAKAYLENRVQPKGRKVVGIHVRRGDLLAIGYVRFPPAEYFESAKNYFEALFQTDGVVFVVIGEDPGWSASQPYFEGNNIHINTESHTAELDFTILASCDAVVMTIGTFGWWAGYLSGGPVVYYKNHFVMEHAVNKGNVVLDDHFPSNWIGFGDDLEEKLSPWEQWLPRSKSKNDWCPSKGSNGEAFVQSLYADKATELSTTCANIKRVGGAGDGGKLLCVDDIRGNDCIVYSLGSRLDFSFEIDIVKRFGCRVHTFDCTVGTPRASQIPAGVSFHPWCVGDKDETKAISSDLGHQGESGQYYTLTTIRNKLGHSTIDLLKMDIERHEFAVVATLKDDNAPSQIAFETHLHNAYGMWGRPVSEDEWTAMWTTLSGLGYGIFAHEPNPLCLCCCEFSLIRRAPLLERTRR